jgi:disease resistance protein RPM1
LQSLDRVNIGTSHPRVVEELAELHQLKRLGVNNLKRNQFEKFSASISQLSCLRSLWIVIWEEEAVVGCLDSVSSPPEHLRSLTLWGMIEKLPDWIASLRSLAKITFWNTGLKEDAIDVLQNLPSLVVLRLYDYAYVGANLTFENNSFPKLRVLMLDQLELEEVIFKEHSLPQFETLDIEDCKLMVGITDIHYLPKLKKLHITRGMVATMDMLQKQIEEHHLNHLEFIHTSD